jgi:hypothetical protein
LWEHQLWCKCLLDNIYIHFGNKVFCQIVGVQMKTNCAPLIFEYVLSKDALLSAIHINVVIHYCKNMWSFWVEANLCKFLFIHVCQYLYSHWKSSYKEGNNLDHIDRINLTMLSTCPKPGWGFTSSYTVFHDLKWNVVDFFADIHGIVDRLNFLFIRISLIFAKIISQSNRIRY